MTGTATQHKAANNSWTAKFTMQVSHKWTPSGIHSVLTLKNRGWLYLTNKKDIGRDRKRECVLLDDFLPL